MKNLTLFLSIILFLSGLGQTTHAQTTIDSTSTSKPSGRYNTGDAIDITVNFDDWIAPFQSLKLTLNTGDVLDLNIANRSNTFSDLLDPTWGTPGTRNATLGAANLAPGFTRVEGVNCILQLQGKGGKATAGKIVLAGSFENYEGTGNHNFVITDENGGLFQGFGNAYDQISWAIETADGGLLLGGNFQDVGSNSNYDYMVKLKYNGSNFVIDTDFMNNLANGTRTLNGRIGTAYGGSSGASNSYNRSTHCIAEDPADGSIYIIGNFTEVGGTARHGVAKLNANGSLNTAFNANYTGGFGATLALDGNSLWVAAGYQQGSFGEGASGFTKSSSSTQYCIDKLNKSNGNRASDYTANGGTKATIKDGFAGIANMVVMPEQANGGPGGIVAVGDFHYGWNASNTEGYSHIISLQDNGSLTPNSLFDIRLDDVGVNNWGMFNESDNGLAGVYLIKNKLFIGIADYWGGSRYWDCCAVDGEFSTSFRTGTDANVEQSRYSVGRLAVLNLDGTGNTTFNHTFTRTGSENSGFRGGYPRVSSLFVTANNQLLAGGTFTAFMEKVDGVRGMSGVSSSVDDQIIIRLNKFTTATGTYTPTANDVTGRLQVVNIAAVDAFGNTVPLDNLADYDVNFLGDKKISINMPQTADKDRFITTWRTTSANESITIPTEGAGYNFTVDWGDGTGSSTYSGTAPTVTHTYATPGIHTVKISANLANDSDGVYNDGFPRIYFNNGTSKDKLLTVEQWGNIQWQSMYKAFHGCSELTSVPGTTAFGSGTPATDAPDLSTPGISFEDMFRNCTKFNSNLNAWNVSQATSFRYMFFSADAFNNGSTSNDGANALTWTMEDGTNVASGSFNGMFAFATNFNQNLNSWNVSRATDFHGMFQKAAFNNGSTDNDGLNALTWTMKDGTNVASGAMNHMFQNAPNFNQNISSWNVSKVTGFAYMFSNAAKFNNGSTVNDGLNALTWTMKDGTNVASGLFNGMFQRAADFNQNLSSWNVSQATEFERMFWDAILFDQDLSDWEISALTTAEYMFLDAKLSLPNYDKLLISWNNQVQNGTANNNVKFHGGSSQYCVGEDARKALIDAGWGDGDDTGTPNYESSGASAQLVDGGADCSGAFITTWKVEAGNQGITIPTTGTGYNFSVDWGDGNTDEFADGDSFTHTYAAPGTYTVKIMGYDADGNGTYESGFPRIYFNNGGDKIKLLTVEQWGDIKWTSMYKAFDGCNNLTSVPGSTAFGSGTPATDAPDLSTADINFREMFDNCYAFNSNISGWNVSRGIDFYGMFRNARAFNNGSTSNDGNNALTWTMKDGSNVASGAFTSMFSGAEDFNQSISSWNVSKATNFASMFASTSGNRFNNGSTSNDGNNALTWTMKDGTTVTSASCYRMFDGANKFNQSLSSWNVSKIADFRLMFRNATLFDQDLSAWDISALTQANDMFSGAKLSLPNYDKLLISWNAQVQNGTANNNVEFHGGNSKYCLGEDARKALIDEGWGDGDDSDAPNYASSGSGVDISDGGADCSGAFITTWKVEAGDLRITIPTEGTGYDFSVNWGDGNTDEFADGDIFTHTYTAPGTYTVKIMGYDADGNGTYESGFPRIYFNHGILRDKLLTVEQWGNIQWQSMEKAFYGCGELTSVPGSTAFGSGTPATDAPDLSTLGISFEDMFRSCPKFNSNLNGWNVSRGTSFRYMFFLATAFNNGSTSNDGANALTWTMKDGTNVASGEFYGMFYEADKFNQNLNSWNVSRVTNFEAMFGATDIFNNGSANNDGLNPLTWTMKDGTIATSAACYRMFDGARKFNQSLSSWNVSKVADFRLMFRNAILFDQDLSAWDISALTQAENMFLNATLSVPHYDALLTAWNAQVQSGSAKTNVTFHGGNSKYCFGEEARKQLIDKGWGDGDDSDAPNYASSGSDVDISDGGADCSGAFITRWKPGGSTITIPTTAGGYSYDVQIAQTNGNIIQTAWGQTGNFTSQNLAAYDTVVVKVSGDFPRIFFNNGGDKNKIISIDQWGKIRWSNMMHAFYGCQNLQLHASDAPDLSGVSILTGMFRGCAVLDADISHWDVSTITTMDTMFQNAKAFDNGGNALNWAGKTANVQDMGHMFEGAETFNRDISGWDFSKVFDFNHMFAYALQFNQEVTNWNFGPQPNKDTDISHMFLGARDFNNGDAPGQSNKPLNWAGKTTKAKWYNLMFKDAVSFNQDVSSWHHDSVEFANEMFSGATSFNNGNTPLNWNLPKLHTAMNMFKDATAFNNGAAPRVSTVLNWQTPELWKASGMFNGASVFNQDISSLDVADISEGQGAQALQNMLDNTAMSIRNYDKLLMAWNQLERVAGTPKKDTRFGAAGIRYCFGADARKAMIDRGWGDGRTGNQSGYLDINDGGSACEVAFITTWKVEAGDLSITIPTTGTGYNFAVDWGDGNTDEFADGDSFTHTYVAAGTYTVKIIGTDSDGDGIYESGFPRIHFNNAGDKNKLLSVEQWGEQQWQSMENAFYGCANLASVPGETSAESPNLSTANISLKNMFNGCSSLDSDISQWNINSVSTAENFLLGAELSLDNYDKLLINWEKQVSNAPGSALNKILFHGGNSPYCLGEEARKSLIDKGWGDGDDTGTPNYESSGASAQLVDGGTDCSAAFITTWNALAGDAIIVPTYGTGYDFTISWGDGTVENLTDADRISSPVDGFKHIYSENGPFTVKITGYDGDGNGTKESGFPRIYFNYAGTKDSIISVDSWGELQWTSMEKAFYGCSKLESVSGATSAESPDLSQVNSFFAIFAYCDSLNSDISAWDVSSVKNMRSAFLAAGKFNNGGQALSWNVSNVENMHQMFYLAHYFNADVSAWNVGNVTNMSNMFRGTFLFNADISNWNVSRVKDMSYMFHTASAFNIDISTWDVDSVTNMEAMFSTTSKFNKDLSNWNVSRVTNMKAMFNDALSFNNGATTYDNTTIDESKPLLWGSKTAKVEDMSHMFERATGFIQDISSWHITSLKTAYNMFKEGGFKNLDFYDNLLINWNAQVQASLADGDATNDIVNVPFYGGEVIPADTLYFGSIVIPIPEERFSRYCAGGDAREQLINAGWGDGDNSNTPNYNSETGDLRDGGFAGSNEQGLVVEIQPIFQKDIGKIILRNFNTEVNYYALPTNADMAYRTDTVSLPAGTTQNSITLSTLKAFDIDKATFTYNLFADNGSGCVVLVTDEIAINPNVKADTLQCVVTVTKNNAEANGTAQNKIQVKFVDVFGEPIGFGQAGAVPSPTANVSFSVDTVKSPYNFTATGEMALTSTTAGTYHTNFELITTYYANNGIDPLGWKNWGNISATQGNPAEYTFVAGKPVLTESTFTHLTASQDVIADSLKTHQFKVELKDANGNPTPGHNITFTATSANGGTDKVRFYYFNESGTKIDFPTGNAAIVRSNSNGELSIYATATKAWTEFKTRVSFHDGASNIIFPTADSVAYSYVAGEPDPFVGSFEVMPATQTVGNAVNITATLLDKYANPCRNILVQINQARRDNKNGPLSPHVSYNGAGPDTISGYSDNNGQYIITASSQVAGIYNTEGIVNISSGPEPKYLSYQFTAGQPDPNHPGTFVELIDDDAEANGTAKNKISVQVSDKYGNLLSNAKVNIAAQTLVDWGSGINTAHSVFTNSSGIAELYGTSTTAGVYQTEVSVDSAGVAKTIADQSTVDIKRKNPVEYEFQPGAPDYAKSIVLITNSPAVANNVDSVHIHITLRDVNENIIPGDTMVFFNTPNVTIERKTGGATSPTHNADGLMVITNSSGVVEIIIKSTKAGHYTTQGTVLDASTTSGYGVVAGLPYIFVHGPAVGNKSKVEVFTNNMRAGLSDTLKVVFLADEFNNILDTIRQTTQVKFSATPDVNINNIGLNTDYIHTLNVGDSAKFKIPVSSELAYYDFITHVSILDGDGDFTNDTLQGSPAQYRFLADSVFTDSCKVEVIDNGQVADGTSQIKIQATLKDKYGNRVPNTNVAFLGMEGLDIGGTDGVGDNFGASTNANGQVTALATATKAGPYQTLVAYNPHGWGNATFTPITNGGVPAEFYFVDEYTTVDEAKNLAIRAKWYVVSKDTANAHTAVLECAEAQAWRLWDNDHITSNWLPGDSISFPQTQLDAVTANGSCGPYAIDFTVKDGSQSLIRLNVVVSVMDDYAVWDTNKELALHAHEYVLSTQQAQVHGLPEAKSKSYAKAWSLSDWSKNNLLSNTTIDPAHQSTINGGNPGTYPLKFTLTDDGKSIDNQVNVHVVDDSDWFITKWAVQAGDEITLPLKEKDGTGYDFIIDWGDGSDMQHLSQGSNFSRTYATADTINIKIAGTFPQIHFNRGVDGEPVDKILSIEQWGNIQWQSMEHAFSGCEKLQINDSISPTHVPDLSAVSDMSFMFENCGKMNSGNLNHWDVSNVTNMNSLFYNAVSFNKTLAGWDVSKVETMFHMFDGALNFNQNISGWDVSKVSNMASLFANTNKFNQDLSNWDVSNVTGMSAMFYLAEGFNSPLNWGAKTEKVENMSAMFYRAKNFDQDISDWEIDSLVTANAMFSGAELSVNHYDSLLVKWNRQLQDGKAYKYVAFDGGNSKYCAGEDARNELMANGWGVWKNNNGTPADVSDDVYEIPDGGSGAPSATSPFVADYAVCINSNYTEIELLQSTSGVSYQLYNADDDSPVGLPVDGVDGAIEFPVTPTQTTTYYAIATNKTYGSCETLLKDSITITVHPASVGGSASPIESERCEGTQAHVSLSGETGSEIHWQVAKNNSGTLPASNDYMDVTGGIGEGTNNYTSDDLWVSNADTTYYFYRARVTSGLCSEVYSSAKKITVYQPSLGGNTNTTTPQLCNGNTAPLTLQNHLGSIQWQVADSLPGGTMSNFADVPGANTANFNTNALTASTDTTYYFFRAVVQNGTCSSVYSDTVKLKVYQDAVGGDASSSLSETCSGNPANLLLQNHLGRIQWQMAKNTNGSMPSSFADLSGAETAAYTTPALTATGDTTYYFFRAEVVNGTCGVNYSDTLRIRVFEPGKGGNTSTTTPEICTGTPADIALQNHLGSIQWQVADSLPGGTMSSFADVPGASTPAYTTSPLTTQGDTTYYFYRAVLTNGTCASVYSDTVKITIYEPSLGGDLSPANTLVAKDGNSTLLTLTAAFGKIVRWESSTDNFASQINPIGNLSNVHTASNLTETTYFRAVVQNGPCSESYSDTAKIEVIDFAKAFTTKWLTTSANESILIPTNGTGYDFSIDWGDGTIQKLNDGDRTAGPPEGFTHTYATPGTYTVRIIGNTDSDGDGTNESGFPRIYFNNAGDKAKIQSVEQWGAILWTSMNKAFAGCNNLEILASDKPDLSATNDLSYMFEAASSINSNLSSWQLGNINNMEGMFYQAGSFNNGGQALTWDVSRVSFMNKTFAHATNFNADISLWNVEEVENMSEMFSQASSFNQNIAAWKVEKVENMSQMFKDASAFNNNNQPLSWGANTATVNNMSSMFQNASAFNQPLNWDVSLVSNMSDMFNGASTFDQDLGAWEISALSNAQNMFLGATLSIANYDALLMGWGEEVENSNANANVPFHGGNSQYCEGDDYRKLLIVNGWGDGTPPQQNDSYPDIADGGKASADISSSTLNTTGIFQEETAQIEVSNTAASTVNYFGVASPLNPSLNTDTVQGNNGGIDLTTPTLNQSTKYVVYADNGICPVIIDSITVNVYPKADTLNSTVNLLTATDKLANGTEKHQIEVTVVDVTGNPIQDAGVVFENNTALNFTPNDTLFTNASGKVVLEITSTVADNYETSVSLFTENPETNFIKDWGKIAATQGNPAQYRFVADVPVQSKSTFELMTTPHNTIVADTVDVHILKATLKDANGNLVPNHAVDVAATFSGSDAVRFYYIDGGGNTLRFAPGTATSGLLSNDAGEVVIYATASKAWLNFSTAATFNDGTSNISFKENSLTYSYIAGVPDYANSTITASPTTQNAGSAITITGTVLDAFNNPCRNIPARIEQATQGGTLSGDVLYNTQTVADTISGTTDNNGQFSITAVSQKAGSYNTQGAIELNGAWSTGKSVDYSFSSANPDPNSSHVQLDQNNSEANGTAQNKISIHVADAFGNPVSGANVKIEAEADVDWGSGTALDHIVPTNANGDAIFFGTSNVADTDTTTVLVDVDGSGTYQPIATGAGIRRNPVIYTFLAGNPTAGNGSIELINNPAVADGIDSVRIRVTLRDASNNPVPGDTIVFFNTNGVNYSLYEGHASSPGLDAGTGDFSVVTTANGIADITIKSTLAGNYITNGAVLINGTPFLQGDTAYTFVPGHADATNSTVRVSKDLQEAGTSDSLKVQLFDAQGNALDTLRQSTSILFAATDSVNINGAGINTAYTHTLNVGDTAVFEIPVTSEIVATYSTAVTLGGTPPLGGSPVSYSFTAASPLVDSCKVEVLINGSLANGTAQNRVRATVKDEFGNPVPGIYVGFRGMPELDLGNGTANHQGVITDARGEASVYPVTTKAGPYQTYVAFSETGWNPASFTGNGIANGGLPAEIYFVDEHTTVDEAENLAIRAEWYVLQSNDALTHTAAKDSAKVVAWRLSDGDGMASNYLHQDSISYSSLTDINSGEPGAYRVDFTVKDGANSLTRTDVVVSVVDEHTAFDKDKELALRATDYVLSVGEANSHATPAAKNKSYAKAWSLSDWSKNDLLSSVTTDNPQMTAIQGANASAVYPLSFSLSDNGQNLNNEVDVHVIADGDWLVTKWVVGAGDAITIPTNGSGYDFIVDWGDGNEPERLVDGDAFTHTYLAGDTVDIKISGDFPRMYFNGGVGGQPVDKIISIEQWGSIAWQSMESAFKGCENLQISDTITSPANVPDLSAVSNMSSMFENCKKLNSPTLNNWDVSGVENMSKLFCAAETFNQELSNWNVNSVENMSHMFYEASDFNRDLSNWNTSSLNDASGMFGFALDFNSPLNWGAGTKNIENMSGMFQNAVNFNQNLSGWQIDSLKTAKDMFLNAELTTDHYDTLLISWNTQVQNAAVNGEPLGNRAVEFHGGTSRYCAAKADRAQLVSTGWGDGVIGGDPDNNLSGTDGIVDGGGGFPSATPAFVGDYAICFGDGTQIELQSSENGVEYQLYDAAADTAVGNPVAGTGTAIFFLVSPQNTTTYYAVATNTTYGSCETLLNDSITIVVDPTSEGGTASPATLELCNNSQTTISLNGYVGNIQWQWVYNNTGVQPLDSDYANATSGTGTTSNVYTTHTLTVENSDTTYYFFRAKVSSGTCSSDVSNVMKVTVYQEAVGGNTKIAPAASDELCHGETSEILLENYLGDIQWQRADSVAGGTKTAFADVSGTTATYTTDALTATADTTYYFYRAVVTNGVCSSDTSDVVRLVVYAEAVGGNTKIATTAGDELCHGETTELVLENYLGHIQWQRADSIAGGTMGAFADLSGTAATYTTNVLTATADTTYYFYRAVVTNGVCSSDTSDVVRVRVYQNAKGGNTKIATTASDELCHGETTELVLENYLGHIQWQRADSVAGGTMGAFADLSGTAATYTTNALTATADTTYYFYRAVVTNGVCSSDTSDVVRVRVYAEAEGGAIIPAESIILSGENKILNLTGQKGSVLKWQSSVSGDFDTDGIDISNTTPVYEVKNLLVSTYYRAIVKNGTCSELVSDTALIRVQNSDYGDAPNSYATLSEDNGPQHLIPLTNTNIIIGTEGPDREANGQPTNNADGDDNTGTDDEDGLISLSFATDRSSVVLSDIPIKNNSGKSGFLYGWIDINEDGIFNDVERAKLDIVAGFDGKVALQFTGFNYAIELGNYFVRLRVGTTQSEVEHPTGLATDGEIEDHLICLHPDVIRVNDSRIQVCADYTGNLNELIDYEPHPGKRLEWANWNGLAVSDTLDASSLDLFSTNLFYFNVAEDYCDTTIVGRGKVYVTVNTDIDTFEDKEVEVCYSDANQLNLFRIFGYVGKGNWIYKGLESTHLNLTNGALSGSQNHIFNANLDYRGSGSEKFVFEYIPASQECLANKFKLIIVVGD